MVTGMMVDKYYSDRIGGYQGDGKRDNSDRGNCYWGDGVTGTIITELMVTRVTVKQVV